MRLTTRCIRSIPLALTSLFAIGAHADRPARLAAASAPIPRRRRPLHLSWAGHTAALSPALPAMSALAPLG